MLALTQLEFAGQSAFAWWALIVGATGLALLAYAFTLRRDARLRQPAHDLARPSPLTAAPQEAPLTLLGFPLALIAGGLGLGSLAITAAMVLLGLPPQLVALLWTALLSAAAIWLFYRRVYRFLSRDRMTTLLSLRLLGMLALLLMLFQPVLAFIHNPSAKEKLAVVIDATGSMSISDEPNEPNRYRQCVLAVRDVLMPPLADHFDIQLFAYDGKHTEPLPNPDEFDRIAPNGQTTDLPAAISLGTNSGAMQVVLFSDGIHNGPNAVAAGLSAVTVPVHTVRVGNTVTEPSTVPDIAVVSVDAPPTATVNNVVTLTASIKSTAMSDRTVKVQLLPTGPERGGNPLDEQRLVLRSGPTPQTIQLKFTPDKVGRTVVRVQVPVDPQERSEANNQQDVPILVTDPKLAVLYVEGRVRPEVGPLRRALEQDPNINAISMVQTTAGHFELRGVKEGDDLRGMPTTLAQWKRFKVIILGDLDASFLNTQQQKDLQSVVKDGAGLLMIGGQNSFAPGGWDKTVLAELLPVTLAKTDPAQINTPFVPQLTAAGLNHSIFKGIAGYFLDPAGHAPAGAGGQMPQLSGCVALASPKPAANVLAVHPSQKLNGNPALVLVTGNYAQGRTAAFAADTTWRWNLFLRSMGKDSPYNRFWGQMVRWLAGQEDLAKKTGASVTAMIPKERYESGEPVVLRCAVTDTEGQSTAYATVAVEIKGPDGKTARLPLSAVADQIGTYEATYKPTLAGPFAATFTASKDGHDLGKDASHFTVMQAAGEMEVLAAQPKTLEEISRLTRGDHTELAGVQRLADRLAAQLPVQAGVTRTSVRLYENRSLFALFIAALALEWFLRRKWQLQ